MPPRKQRSRRRARERGAGTWSPPRCRRSGGAVRAWGPGSRSRRAGSGRPARRSPAPRSWTSCRESAQQFAEPRVEPAASGAALCASQASTTRVGFQPAAVHAHAEAGRRRVPAPRRGRAPTRMCPRWPIPTAPTSCPSPPFSVRNSGRLPGLRAAPPCARPAPPGEAAVAAASSTKRGSTLRDAERFRDCRRRCPRAAARQGSPRPPGRNAPARSPPPIRLRLGRPGARKQFQPHADLGGPAQQRRGHQRHDLVGTIIMRPSGSGTRRPFLRT